tara:strand:- start:459 stop:1121 length:663 start_codon:yes stop_codon:yes gene_type:complete
MANQIETLNGIAVTSIEAVNGLADAAIEKINGLEFTGTIPDAHTLIATATASSSATLEFTSGIDSTYDVYEFHFTNMHPQTDSVYPKFQPSTNGGSSYGVATTTTYVRAHHAEDDSSAGLAYVTGYDSAQSTGLIQIGEDVGADADQSLSGIMKLYAPSSTTYVKHFTIDTQNVNGGNWSANQFIAGYVNTTSAVNAIQFSFSSGNIDAGVIKMYGIATS